MIAPFEQANPHALAALVAAGETHSIEASEDIVDAQGVKLWARGKPVAAELVERLVDRRLRRPIEQCLAARDGIDAGQVVAETARLLEGSPYLSLLAGREARRLLEIAGSLPLVPPVALLMTAAKGRGDAFTHACLVMLLAGALAARCGSDVSGMQRAMLAALVHDIGEQYVNPEYLRSRRELSLEEWRHVSAHPRVGELFVQTNTRYPKQIAALVAAHHERLDGTGYPARAVAPALPEGAGYLLVAETMAGVMNDPVSAPARAVLAMGLVFGEYPMGVVNHVVLAQRSFPVEGSVTLEREAARERVVAVRDGLERAREVAATLEDRIAHDAERRSLKRLAPLLTRLGAAFVSTGTAHYFDLVEQCADADAELVLQLELVPREVRWRMRSLARDVAQDLGAFPDGGRERFAPLLDALRGESAVRA
ncbi:MAG: HD domain-containing protein [Burkholderiales bacterium]|nr:MAG: HD domain-containing protein [Burkholderiales bacterium]